MDADVLLPPRKRLLAGLKKQNGDGNSQMPSTSTTSSEFDTRLNNLLRSHSNNPNLSSDEIVEASRLAAAAAVKFADAARAAAEEKAAIAARAMAAAKRALELVATVSEETGFKEKQLKNKTKKHVPVKMLYNKKNCKTDEELARKLHQAMNSSPRISKNSSTSDLKSHKHKRLKSLSSSEKSRVSNGSIVQIGNPASTRNGNGIVGEVDSEGSIQESNLVRVDENTSKYNKADRLMMENGEAVTIHSNEKFGESLEDTCSLGRKRGRIKQKKLPLSICNIRDQAIPKEELKLRSLSIEESLSKATAGNKPFFSVGPSGDSVMPVERTSMWKCQAFKAPACVKQNKVMQS